MTRTLRLPMMLLAFIALLAALWGGLIRIGWSWPVLSPTLVGTHGPLMISGFLGTLISLERAVALDRRWAYLAPLCCGLGALLVIAGISTAGATLATLGSLVTVAIFTVIIRLQPALFTATMGLAAVTWLGGNLLWLAGRPISQVVLWWAGFLVLTIVGERLELSRLLRLTRRHQGAYLVASGLLLVGIVTSLIAFDGGTRLAGAGMLALAAWLGRYDLARRTVRRSGLTRFIAVALLAGYAWLAVAGLLALAYGGIAAGPRYDAMLHAIFVGFVISMIFGHAPIIYPAVLGLPMTFGAIFYAHLVLLHVSLLIRVGGDMTGLIELRRTGGLLNALAILLFLGMTARSVWIGRPTPAHSAVSQTPYP